MPVNLHSIAMTKRVSIIDTSLNFNASLEIVILTANMFLVSKNRT